MERYLKSHESLLQSFVFAVVKKFAGVRACWVEGGLLELHITLLLEKGNLHV